MTHIMAQAQKALLGLSVGLLVVALLLEIPNQILADSGGGGGFSYYAMNTDCPKPKNPTGCGTAPDNCNSGNQCQDPSYDKVCNCEQGDSACPCKLEGDI